MSATVLPTFVPAALREARAEDDVIDLRRLDFGTRRSTSRTHCTRCRRASEVERARNDLARPLRTLATITASRIGASTGRRRPSAARAFEERADAFAGVRMRRASARRRRSRSAVPSRSGAAARPTQGALISAQSGAATAPRASVRSPRRVEDLGGSDRLLRPVPLRGAAPRDGFPAEDHEPRARPGPTTRGRRWVPPRARQDAMRTSGSPMRASYAAIRMSHASAISSAPPMQKP